MREAHSSSPTAQRSVTARAMSEVKIPSQIFCSKSQIMQKKPLSHAQMAFAIVAAIVLCAPGLYLMFAKHSPWLSIVTLALSQGFLVWKKRGAAHN